MVTLLYGIAIGIVITLAVLGEIEVIRSIKRERMESDKKLSHAMQDMMEMESKKDRIFEVQSISEQIIVAVENEDYEEAARLRDKLKNEKLR